MAEKPQVTASEPGAADLRGKLIKRLAVAGAMVAVLLGILAVFDYLAAPTDEADLPEYSRPVPVAPKKEVSKPVTPAENLPEPPEPEKAEPVVEPPPPPEVSAPTPVAASPGENRPPATSTAAAKQGVVQLTPRPRTVPEATTAPIITPGKPAAIAPDVSQVKPVPRVVEPRPAAPSGIARLFSGFVLQAGVFTSAQRAEELHARLTLSGVPSTLETRVQVGPFRTRQEAEAAQAKLRELGIETILVPPRDSRH